MKYVFKALKPLNTCWSVGKKVVEMAVRQLCSYALRASLGTRFTRAQVTPRSSALNAVVEDAQMFQMVISTLQSSQRPAAS